MKSAQKSSFKRLIEYLSDSQGKEERVGEITFTNVLSEGNEFAMKEIMLTQDRNTRAKSDKTYHLTLSFREGEQPSPQVLKEIEVQVCNRLGFAEHQRVSVVHRDTDNLHVHLAINKIHPEKYTIKEPYYDKKELGKICASLEQEYSLAVDNHANRKTESQAKAVSMEKVAGMESFIGWVQRECLPAVKQAQSWEELHLTLAEHGLEIKEKGRGLVIVSRDEVGAKASSIDRDLSKQRLETRLGKYKPKTHSTGENNEYYTHTPKFHTEQARPIAEHRMRELSSRRLAHDRASDSPPSVLSSDARLDKRGFETLRRPDREREERGELGGSERKYSKASKDEYSTEPKREYSKRPTPNKQSSGQLWDAYKKEMDQVRAAQQKESLEARARRDQLIVSARRSRKVQKFFLRAVKYKVIRQLANAIFSKATDRAIKMAKDTYSSEREAIYAKQRRPTWNDWLKQQAKNGNQEAMDYLQARRTTPPDGDTFKCASKSQQAKTSTCDSVTNKGTKIFKGGVRDSGEAVQMTQASPEQMLAGLKLAQEKWPDEAIIVTGSELFKQNVINLAVENNLQVKFSDSLMEESRKQLQKDHNILDSVDKYIAKRNSLRLNINDIMEHKLFKAEDAGEASYAGVRGQDGQSMALFKRQDKMLVLPVSEDVAARLKQLKVGDTVKVSRTGQIEKQKTTRRSR